MAAATVIHFGWDDGYRVQALQAAGYDVRESLSLDALRRDVERDDVDAVLVSEAEAGPTEQAAALVRQHTGAPLILFRRSGAPLDESRFDRVFSWRIPAANWLFDTAVVVMQSKELRTQSEKLREEAEGVRAESLRQMERSKTEVRRNKAVGSVWRLATDE